MSFGVGAVFSGINTAFRFAEFVIHLNEVGSENAVFVRTIQRVRLDLEETERLLRVPSIRPVLASNPGKLSWVESAVQSTKHALNEIGLYVERARSDHDRDGSISFANRVRWVLKNQDKLENRRSELAACHQSLAAVLATLHPLELMVNITLATAIPDDIAPPVYTAAPTESEFVGPHKRRMSKKRIAMESKVDGKDGYANAQFKSSWMRQEALNQNPIMDSNCPRTEDDEKMKFDVRIELNELEHLHIQDHAMRESPGSAQHPSSSTPEPRHENIQKQSPLGSTYLGPVDPWDLLNETYCPKQITTSAAYTEVASLAVYESPVTQNHQISSTNNCRVNCQSPLELYSMDLQVGKPPYMLPLNRIKPLSTKFDDFSIDEGKVAELPWHSTNSRAQQELVSAFPINGAVELHSQEIRQINCAGSKPLKFTDGSNMQFQELEAPLLSQAQAGIHSPRKVQPTAEYTSVEREMSQCSTATTGYNSYNYNAQAEVTEISAEMPLTSDKQVEPHDHQSMAFRHPVSHQRSKDMYDTYDRAQATQNQCQQYTKIATAATSYPVTPQIQPLSIVESPQASISHRRAPLVSNILDRSSIVSGGLHSAELSSSDQFTSDSSANYPRPTVSSTEATPPHLRRIESDRRRRRRTVMSSIYGPGE